MSDFLNIKDKYFLITGISNKKSVAYFSAKTLFENGAKLIFSVQNQKQVEFCKSRFPDSPCYQCDLENSDQVKSLANEIRTQDIVLSGMLHSVAFARFESEDFHETNFDEFSQALKISAFSLVELSKELKPFLDSQASIVTVSISSLRATSYGYMGPIKAMLNSSIDYLAKSFSKTTKIRFNAIAAGPLKTAASAGIPKYMENYLFSEKLTLRKEGIKTQEVADAITYLLSPRSSGINASTLTVDAGMNVNYFDEEIVRTVYNSSL